MWEQIDSGLLPWSPPPPPTDQPSVWINNSRSYQNLIYRNTNIIHIWLKKVTTHNISAIYKVQRWRKNSVSLKKAIIRTASGNKVSRYARVPKWPDMRGSQCPDMRESQCPDIDARFPKCPDMRGPSVQICEGQLLYKVPKFGPSFVPQYSTYVIYSSLYAT